MKRISSKQKTNIIVLGSAESGKTTLVSAISKVQSMQGFAGYVSYDELQNESYVEENDIQYNCSKIVTETKSKIINLYDFHNYIDYFKVLLGSDEKFDGGILVIDAEEGITPQLIDLLKVAKETGIPEFISYVNGSDKVDDKELALKVLETKAFLAEAGYFNIPVIAGSALMTLNSDDPEDKYHKATKLLMKQVDKTIIPLKTLENLPFSMNVEESSKIGEKTLISGKVKTGILNHEVNDLELVGYKSNNSKVTLTDIIKDNDSIDLAKAGDKISLLTDTGTRPAKGQIVTIPGNMVANNEFKAMGYFFTYQDGGKGQVVFDGYKPRIYMHNTNFNSTINFPEGIDMVASGVCTNMTVKLRDFVGLEKGMKFLIQDEGKVIGVGKIVDNL